MKINIVPYMFLLTDKFIADSVNRHMGGSNTYVHTYKMSFNVASVMTVRHAALQPDNRHLRWANSIVSWESTTRDAGSAVAPDRMPLANA